MLKLTPPLPPRRVKVHLGPQVDFGELNDKAIKGLMILSKIVSRFSLYIHKQPLMYLIVDEYFGSHL
jgi:hypothetical protein